MWTTVWPLPMYRRPTRRIRSGYTLPSVFMRKLEKKRDYIAYFQYSPELYAEVKQYIPAQMREQIDWELEPWIENMTFTEKRIKR